MDKAVRSVTPPTKAVQSKQYDLFTSFFGDPTALSNTIELWDAIPKYAVSARHQNAARDENGHLPVYVQDFEYKSADLNEAIECRVKVRPASIEIEPGVYKQFYPSQNEEIIEEVLKKIFTDQRYGLHYPAETESWVTFTLYMIQRELKKRHKSRSIQEIKQSLEIMALATLEVQMAGRGRGIVYTNPILMNLTRQTREDLLEDPNGKWVAQLPALVSKGVNELTYRQFNYMVHMDLSTPLSRWLHKRFIHRYRNASIMAAYNFKMTSISRDSGLLRNKRTNANMDAIDEALDVLIDKDVLVRWEKDIRRTGNKIDDVVYKVFASSEFTREIKAAHARHNESRGIRSTKGMRK